VKVWVDDRLVEQGDAKVSAFDHGFTVGDGVFETLKVIDGTPFAWTRHVHRLTASAAGLGLPLPEEGRLRAAVAAVLGANPPAASGRLRITWTGGVGPAGSERGAAPATLVVVLGDLRAWEPSCSLATVPWARNERSAVAGLKTTSYAENVVALAYAHRHGADEALLLDTRGRVCEGTGSNVFVVLDGRLVTPGTDTGCLAGVTRALVMDWCWAEAAELTPADLEAASEVFITSSTRDIQPVHAVDEHRFDAPGPISAKAVQTFAERAAQDLDP
jgi:branched-chain amino acid aminotransferase